MPGFFDPSLSVFGADYQSPMVPDPFERFERAGSDPWENYTQIQRGRYPAEDIQYKPIDHDPFTQGNTLTPIDHDPWETKLSEDDEKKFQTWKQQYAPNDSGADYDLRGAFKEGLTPSPIN